MDTTRQHWQTAALVVTLAGLAPLTGSVAPLVGAAVVSGWFVAAQLAAVRSLRSTAADATLAVEFDSPRADVGTSVGVTVTVERPKRATGTALTVTYPTPPVAEPVPEADRRVELAPSETEGSTTFGLRSSVPARIRLSEPSWRLVDASCSVTESYTRGPTPAVDIVGAANDGRQASRGGGGVDAHPFGDSADRQSGRAAGVDRLRPYEVTDSAARIDWNTTARLGEPYVRETATRSGRPTTLIVDLRAKLLAGGDETMFDAVRSVALGVAATAADRGDPLGLITVDDNGATSVVEPTSRPASYDEISRRLQKLDPTPTDRPAGLEVDHAEPAGRVGSADHAVGRLLNAFGTAALSGTDRWPLVAAVQCQGTTTPGSTVIITDDTDRAELRAAVRAALRTAANVVVYLTPRVRFDADPTTRTARTSDRYRGFEQFRRRLDSVDGVTVREVAPGVERWSDGLATSGGPARQPRLESGSTPRSTGRQTNEQTSRQTNGQTSRQTNEQTNEQKTGDPSEPNTATRAVSNGGSNE